MPGEPRRSGRATKGQHTRTHSEPEEPPAKRQRGKGNASTDRNHKEPRETEEEDAVIRCVCGLEDDDDGGRMMICCDNCSAWQHNDCMGITENENELPESYMCEMCKPEDHKDLVVAMANGEKPWEAIAKRRMEEKKNRKRKGGRRGRFSKQMEVDDLPSGNRENGDENAIQVAASSVPAKDTKDTEPLTMDKPESVNDEVSNRNTPGEKKQKAVAPELDEQITTSRRDSKTKEHKPRERDLSPYRKRSIEYIQSSISSLIRLRAKEGNYRIPDGDTADSLSLRIAYEIEKSMVKYMKQNSTYKEKVRSIVFNVKKNQVLLDKLLLGSLSTDELVQMSTDDMASEELQRQMAVMKEEADKQAILIKEEGPRIRKTHKGEEIIGDDGSNRAIQPDSSTEKTGEAQINIGNGVSSPSSPVKLQTYPASERFGNPRGKRALRVNTTTPLRGNTHERKSSETFNLQKVWSSAHSPGSAGFHLPQQTLRRHSSANSQYTPPLAEEDPDIDRLLNDEDNESDPYSPTNFTDSSTVWSGRLTMTNLIDTISNAKFIAGGDIERKIPWTDIIPSDIHVSGRIGTSTADEYVASMRHTTTTDVACLSINPVDERSGRPQFERLFSYLHQRSRWGVISQYTHPAVKDIYVVPIEAGSGELPKFIGFLDNCSLENPRPRNMIVLTLIVKTQSPVQSALNTPQILDVAEADAGITSMTQTGEAQQTSPLQSDLQTSPFHGSSRPSDASEQFNSVPRSTNTNGFASTSLPTYSSSHQNPYHSPFSPSITSESSAAVRVLGPFVDLPIVKQLLSAQPDVTEHQMRNLRDILERVPSARNDLNTFQAELFKLNYGTQQQQP